jgi:hypothetical protein
MGVKSRRMVVPYQMWMLERIAQVLRRCVASDSGDGAVVELLSRFERGSELLDLDSLIAGCRVHKEGARLFSVPQS